MARYVVMVLSNPVKGKEAEYERWYVDQHIPDILRVPGFVSGRLLPASALQPALQKDRRWDYMALLEADTEDLGALIAELDRRVNTPEMPVSEAFSFEGMHFEIFGELSSEAGAR